MKTLIIVLIIGMFFYEAGMELLNYSYRHKPIPDELKDLYSLRKYNRWIQYQTSQIKYHLFEKFTKGTLLVSFFYFDFFPWLNDLVSKSTDVMFLQYLSFYLIFQLLFFLVEVPLRFYLNFVLETKFGFNQLTKKLFISDLLKELFIGTFIQMLLFGGLFILYQLVSNNLWYFLISTYLIIVGFMVMAFLLNGIFIRIFYHLKPIENGELKSKIETLGERTGFQVKRIFTMDASKRSTKLNAFFSGIGKAKEIVLYDTLIEKMSDEEILAVLAHELGHAKHRDTQGLLLRQLFVIFALVCALGVILNTNSLYLSFGFTEIHLAFAFILVDELLAPLTIPLHLWINSVSRKMEFKADQFAANQTSALDMTNALRTLALENLVNLTPHPIYVKVKYNHPPMRDRFNALK